MRHGYLNDGSLDAPKLRVFLNLDNLSGLDARSALPPGLKGPSLWERLRRDGFEGVQLTNPEPAPLDLGLPFCGLNRVNAPGEADALVAHHKQRGDLCLTLHVAWGLESDAEMDALIQAIHAASERHALPVFIETHRATLTQDMWRTVELAKRCPFIRFNGDFSHYYCGQEMPYGDFDAKVRFLGPVFDRVGFMHGRIANPGCMQAPVGPDLRQRPEAARGARDYLVDFRTLWTHAMAGFQRNARAGDVLIFAPELLSGEYYYARVFQREGQWVEESDRYAQALLYRDLARECWADAKLLGQHR
ncbi:hypothetical protein [Nibricoccus sp. IMCC34717]|uniref:hypothetical protein n=1 Tax=Nibricoccus sp. IMCC34717 TaxID=3034021 RepID=UPI00384AB03C